jgi:hypothetical protein
MKLPADPGSHVWPDPSQEHLLKAALGDGRSPTEEEFHAWLDLTDIEGPIDEGTYRTLPMLWSNLARLGLAHPLLPRLKGVFRNSWVTSTRQLALTSDLIRAFESEGIRTMVSKGLPLALLFYDKPALRPMNDIDIIVPSTELRRATRLLEEKGFLASRRNWEIETALRHALMHRHPKHGEVDLHWHLLFELPRHKVDQHFWSGAVPIRIGEAETLRPSTSDMLLHVLIHGVRWNLSPPMRWIPDALMILRSDDAIDWDRIARFARANRMAGRVALGLSFLRDRFEAAIPREIIGALARSNSAIERLEAMAMRGRDERSAWRHLRRTTYLLRLLQSDHRARLPRAVVSELKLRLRNRFHRDSYGNRPLVPGSRVS